MKVTTTATILTAASLLSAAVAAPTNNVQLASRGTCAAAAQKGLTRGCDTEKHYYVCTGGVETIYTCAGGCKTNANGQPRCDDGQLLSSMAINANPITVVPVG